MSHNQKKHANQIRIIGGKWRSRKLSFPDGEGLRPTPDRIRETLFNWLSPYIVGAHCLDAFAGSGALGFEALSRGASSVMMLDHSPQVVDQLQKNAVLLDIPKAVLTLHCGDMLSGTFFLRNAVDIVFLDPPFYQHRIAPSLLVLQEKKYLAENALIYVEAERDITELPLPKGWEVVRHKVAGQVGYWLVTLSRKTLGSRKHKSFPGSRISTLTKP